MSSKGVSHVYVHKSNQAVGQETYLKECIDKRLPALSFSTIQMGITCFDPTWPEHIARMLFSNV